MSDYEWEEDDNAVVLDFGSDVLQWGLAGDDAPRERQPCVVGRPSERLWQLKHVCLHSGLMT